MTQEKTRRESQEERARTTLSTRVPALHRMRLTSQLRYIVNLNFFVLM